MPPAELPPGVRQVDRWAVRGSLLLAVVGVALAGYLTAEHFATGVSLACPQTATVNCRKVTSSAQSVVAGIPVAVWGLGYFAALVGLCLPAAWRSGRPVLRWLRLAVVAAGVPAVLWLIYVELYVVDAICLWCTAAHVVTVVLFALVTLGEAAARPAAEPAGTPTA